jgi:hypothetical protein
VDGVWSDRTVKVHITVYLHPLNPEHRIVWVRELKENEGGGVQWKEEKEKTRKEKYEENMDNMRTTHTFPNRTDHDYITFETKSNVA